MKQDLLFDDGRVDPLTAEHNQGEADTWPAQWAWEDDNSADGRGVGPFPTARKPPKRAERHLPVPATDRDVSDEDTGAD